MGKAALAVKRGGKNSKKVFDEDGKDEREGDSKSGWQSDT